MMHAKAFTLAAVIAGSLGVAGSAHAAPFSPAPLATATDDALIERTAGGCGPGFHPNPWGICRPNWGPRRYWGGPGPYGYYRPRPVYRPYGYDRPRPFYW